MNFLETPPHSWGILTSPWHLNEKLDSFPRPLRSKLATATMYPGTNETGPLIDRYRDVADAVAVSRLPLLLSGDCLAAIGMVAGLQREHDDLAVVWLDAHGDFNTPTISRSGYLAGMSLAMVTGRAGEVLSESVGLRPVADDRALLIGARDLDHDELNALEASGVRRATAEPTAVRAALEEMSPANVFVHLDVDILDRSCLPAPLRWETSDGPSLAAVEECLTQIAAYSPPVGVCLACPWASEEIGDPSVVETLGRLANALGIDL